MLKSLLKWRTVQLSEIAQIRTGVAKGKKNLKNPATLPYLRVANVKDGYLDLTEIKHIEIEQDQLNRYSLQAGDVLMTEGGDIDKLGRGDVWLGKIEPCLHQNHVFSVRCDTTILLPIFLTTLAGSEYGKRYFRRCAKQTTNLASINSTQLKGFPVLLPPLPEQQKIASILSAVDNKLNLIDRKITATRTLKKGLMQRLFSQGVGTRDADGHWQPHTEFKDSELGQIPAGWKATLLDELANRGSGHTPDKQMPEYWNGGIKWISLADSNKLDKGTINTTDKEISLLGIDGSSAVLHSKGTVVISRDAGIGKSAVMGADMAVSQHFIAWNCKPKNRLNNWFLYYLLQLMKPEFERIAIGSTIKTIGLPYFKKLKIAHPVDLVEQNKIAEVLSTVDGKLTVLTTQKTQTQQLKKGLMQKLLTGQIRVKTEQEPTSP